MLGVKDLPASRPHPLVIDWDAKQLRGFVVRIVKHVENTLPIGCYLIVNDPSLSNDVKLDKIVIFLGQILDKAASLSKHSRYILPYQNAGILLIADSSTTRKVDNLLNALPEKQKWLELWFKTDKDHNYVTGDCKYEVVVAHEINGRPAAEVQFRTLSEKYPDIALQLWRTGDSSHPDRYAIIAGIGLQRHEASALTDQLKNRGLTHTVFWQWPKLSEDAPPSKSGCPE
jgi:hypothetical protein